MSAEPGLRERKRLETRRHIATTAVEMFLKRGFDEVSVAQVAEAAGVSKMTVFNHFPAKEELVLEIGGPTLPDLATAVRARAGGVSPIAAMRAVVIEEFRARAREQTDPARVVAFLRMAFRAPTLMQAFGNQWSSLQVGLAQALAQAIGVPEPPTDVQHRILRALRDEGEDAEMNEWLSRMTPESMKPHFAAGQVISALQQLSMTNLVRMAAGVSPAESTEVMLRDVDTAFEMLEHGLSDFGASG